MFEYFTKRELWRFVSGFFCDGFICTQRAYLKVCGLAQHLRNFHSFSLKDLKQNPLKGAPISLSEQEMVLKFLVHCT